jgi:hypothetical protein
MRKKAQQDSASVISPALKEFIDTCLVPILVDYHYSDDYSYDYVHDQQQQQHQRQQQQHAAIFCNRDAPVINDELYGG